MDQLFEVIFVLIAIGVAARRLFGGAGAQRGEDGGGGADRPGRPGRTGRRYPGPVSTPFPWQPVEPWPAAEAEAAEPVPGTAMTARPQTAAPTPVAHGEGPPDMSVEDISGSARRVGAAADRLGTLHSSFDTADEPRLETFLEPGMEVAGVLRPIPSPVLLGTLDRADLARSMALVEVLGPPRAKAAWRPGAPGARRR